MTDIFDGNALQGELLESIKSRSKGLSEKPKLVILSSQASPESLLYIKKKISFGERAGCLVEHVEMDPSLSAECVRGYIEETNSDSSVDGMVLQLPFSSPFPVSEAIDLIDPDKDVDGLTSSNMGSLLKGEERVLPATTRGVLEMLSHYEITLEGKKVAVVGRSALVGRPTFAALLNRNATVVVCHSVTSNLNDEVRSADVVVSAVGKPGLITSEMFSPKQIIIDVGISVESNGRLRGDVDYQSALGKVKALSPVPGGVGPLTVACLFLNLIDLSEKRRN